LSSFDSLHIFSILVQFSHFYFPVSQIEKNATTSRLFVTSPCGGKKSGIGGEKAGEQKAATWALNKGH
jgi:hypothetical protein